MDTPGGRRPRASLHSHAVPLLPVLHQAQKQGGHQRMSPVSATGLHQPKPEGEGGSPAWRLADPDPILT